MEKPTKFSEGEKKSVQKIIKIKHSFFTYPFVNHYVEFRNPPRFFVCLGWRHHFPSAGHKSVCVGTGIPRACMLVPSSYLTSQSLGVKISCLCSRCCGKRLLNYFGGTFWNKKRHLDKNLGKPGVKWDTKNPKPEFMGILAIPLLLTTTNLGGNSQPAEVSGKL